MEVFAMKKDEVTKAGDIGETVELLKPLVHSLMAHPNLGPWVRNGFRTWRSDHQEEWSQCKASECSCRTWNRNCPEHGSSHASSHADSLARPVWSCFVAFRFGSCCLDLQPHAYVGSCEHVSEWIVFAHEGRLLHVAMMSFPFLFLLRLPIVQYVKDRRMGGLCVLEISELHICKP